MPSHTLELTGQQTATAEEKEATNDQLTVSVGRENGRKEAMETAE